MIDNLFGELLLELRSMSEVVDDSSDLAQSNKVFVRDVAKIRDTEERHKVMTAHRHEPGFYSSNLVIVLVVWECFNRWLVFGFETLGHQFIHCRNPPGRFFEIWVVGIQAHL